MAILTATQVAKMTGKSQRSVLNAIREKRLKAQKIGRMWFIDEEDISKTVDKRSKVWRENNPWRKKER